MSKHPSLSTAPMTLEESIPEQRAMNSSSSSVAKWVNPEILDFPLGGATLTKRQNQKPERAMLGRSSDRPIPKDGIRNFGVADEMLLLRPQPEQGLAVSLNQSARAIWGLCDGQRTQADISYELSQQYGAPTHELNEHLSTALQRFEELALIDISPPALATRPPVKFVVGIEDRTYFHWQLPIFIESFRDQLPPYWEILLVICNNHDTLTAPLSQIIQTYGIRYFTTTNHPFNHSIDFSKGQDRYVPINRIQALSAVADYVQPDDLVCLMETDIFLYKGLNLDVIPTGNALSRNWIIGQEQFFTIHEEPKGVNLHKLLESLDCSTDFQPGGVIVFLTGATIKNKKFIQDCFRFTQILFLMGRMLEVPKVWVAEMPSFALSLSVNGISYELLDDSEFTTQNVSAPSINPGSFYHYYHDLMDGGDGAFHQSKWYKQLFKTEDFLHSDTTQFSLDATTDHEKYFFSLVERAQRRLFVSHT